MKNQFDLVPRSPRVLARPNGPRRIPPTLAVPRPNDHGDLRKAVAVVVKHWKAAAIFALASVVLVTVATLLMPSTYEPQGRLQIDPPGQETFSLQSSSGETTDAEYVNTEAQKLQTNELAQATLKALYAGENGNNSGANVTVAPAALADFRGHLSVRRDPGSRLVAVQFASQDPQYASLAINTLMKLFIERSFQARHDAITQSSLWLSKQLDDIRAKMEQSAQDLARFQKEHGIVDTDQGATSGFEALTELNKQLAEATSQRIQFEAFAKHASDTQTLPQYTSSPVVQGLKQKRAEANAELAQTRVIYGPNHPNVKKLEGQIAEYDRELLAQAGSVRSELDNSYTAAMNREASLRHEVDRATGQLGTLEQYANLKKQAQADRQLYDGLYSKIKESGIAAASKSSNIHVVEEAPVLDRPTRPHRMLNILLGVLFGLVGGVVLAFVKEGFEDRIHTMEDVRNWTGLSSVVVVPELRNVGSGRKELSVVPQPSNTLDSRACLLLDTPNTPESEAVNALRTFVLLADPSSRNRVFLVTSPLPGDGKTTMATNLAVSLSKIGRTCLIDADLRRPRVARSFRLQPGMGIAELLRGNATLDEVIQPVRGPEGLSIIGAWSPTMDAAELLSGTQMAELLTRLRSMFDYIVVDTPPVLPYAEARVISAMVDGVVLVGRAAVTPRAALKRTTELLNEVNSAPVLTVVLNGADHRSDDYRYHYATY